jgi:hypothetical protein
VLERKLEFWKSSEQDNFECLLTLHNFLTEQFFSADEVSSTILQHIRDLRSSLAEYFPTPNDDNAWVQNPFVITAEPVGFNVHDYKRLTDKVSLI